MKFISMLIVFLYHLIRNKKNATYLEHHMYYYIEYHVSSCKMISRTKKVVNKEILKNSVIPMSVNQKYLESC